MVQPHKRCRAVVVARAGGPEVLELRQIDIPAPGRNELLIEVHAAGINRHDCNQRKAGPGHARTDVLGLEAAGLVIAVGEGVAASWIGKRICALVDGGGYADYCIADPALCLETPEAFSDVEAASLPEGLFTTWLNLFEMAKLKPGELVLIHGGTSGVGSIAIQALSSLGYKVFTTCGEDRKCAAALSLGAAGACDYHSAHLSEDILAASDNQSMDVILDMSAGAHIESDFKVLAPHGRILHLSGGGGKNMPVPLAKLMAKRASITGALLRGAPLEEKQRIAEQIRSQIWGKIVQCAKPVISATFPLDQAREAHTLMEMNQHIGKIILRTS